VDRRFKWGLKDGENEMDQMLWLILYSSSELLTSSDMERIGICEGDGCGWLFYDQSRNRSGKWSDTGDCGSRAKARRFYKRKRENKE
jgi:predicted RNA-binding Zn ribbon-like protein